VTFTLHEAAERAGKSKSTLHRALKSGKLSGSRGDDGTWSIDPAELARVFPWNEAERSHDRSTEQSWNGTTERPGDGLLNAQALAVKVEMLEAQLRREQETVDDLRTRLDRAEERAFALAAPLAERRQSRPLLDQLKDFFGLRKV
jgi:hypothetical protein